MLGTDESEDPETCSGDSGTGPGDLGTGPGDLGTFPGDPGTDTGNPRTCPEVGGVQDPAQRTVPLAPKISPADQF